MTPELPSSFPGPPFGAPPGSATFSYQDKLKQQVAEPKQKDDGTAGWFALASRNIQERDTAERKRISSIYGDVPSRRMVGGLDSCSGPLLLAESDGTRTKINAAAVLAERSYMQYDSTDRCAHCKEKEASSPHGFEIAERLSHRREPAATSLELGLIL